MIRKEGIEPGRVGLDERTGTNGTYNFKVREELGGGYLFRHQQGSATRLSPREYSLLKSTWTTGNLFHSSTADIVEKLFPENMSIAHQWLSNLQTEGLFGPDGSVNARFIFSETPLSGECLAAPSRIYLELTRGCNLRCRTCLNSSGRPLEGELTLSEIHDVIAELDRIGTFEVRFTGGEPTVHPDFFDIVEYTRRKGLYVSLATNGVYREAGFRDRVVGAGIDWFRVSLDGPEDVNDYIRGKGSFAETIRTIETISKTTDARLTISTVIGRYNANRFGEFIELISPYRLESISTLPLRPTGRASKLLVDQMLTRREWNSLAKEVFRLKKTFGIPIKLDYDIADPNRRVSEIDRLVETEHSCAAGIEGACISPIGDFYGCGYSPASDLTADPSDRDLFLAGNIRHRSIIEIWRDSSRWKIFRDLETSKGACQECGYYGVQCFGACPVTVHFMREAGKFDGRDPYCIALLGGISD